ncbi:MAG TPA: SsrA-binding protein SmpB [Candidatus Limnocylindrales bacterium]|nr:SsrA-binding protein SmpB [Candidatus Limnocylindrales bacterium]
MDRRSCVRGPVVARSTRVRHWRSTSERSHPMGETIAQNRRARHDYSVEDTFEAGLVLRGTEIKSVRAHKVSLADAYARIDKDEAWIVGLHIAPWESADVRFNHEPKRARKLLLHRSEIDELLGKTKAKGLTLVPLSIYINDRGKAKLSLGLARGKQTWDRRREIADRDAKRDLARQVADARRR